MSLYLQVFNFEYWREKIEIKFCKKIESKLNQEKTTIRICDNITEMVQDRYIFAIED